MQSTALADLTAAFDDTFDDLGKTPDLDASVAVLSWPSVPVEIVRAAGLRPVMLRGASSATPSADAHLEPNTFPRRLRRLVDAALTGRLAHVARLIVPRTSDADYKTFLYLCEFMRQGACPPLAPVRLFDLLQSPGLNVRAYDVERTHALLGELASASGHAASDEDLRREITKTNAARAAARRLAALRKGIPRIAGTAVFPLLGAFWLMPPDEYARLAATVADHIADNPPLDGPRIFLAGAPVDTTAVHATIESHGAVVVAELSPWGSGVAGDDVASDDDPITAIADKYRTDSIGARMPVAALTRWTERVLEEIDAVVVSLPPDDSVFGWDYPALRDRLDARRIPHLCLRGDPYQPASPADHAQIDALITAATRRHEARNG